jgi:hypothetical protein
MLDGLVADLGGDPTAITPGANRELVALRGIAEVVLDPRSSLLDGLEAVLFAELADHEQWSNLIELARELRADDLVRIFVTAQTTQEEHLSKLRRWISSGRELARHQLADRARRA